MTARLQRIIGIAMLAAVLGVAAAAAYASAPLQDDGGFQRIAAAFQGPGDGAAGGRGPGRGGRGGPGGGPLAGLPLGRLELTDAQREQVRSVMEAKRQESQAIGKRLLTARQALEAAITSETYDEGRVRAQAAELANVEADAAVQRAQVFQDVWRLLTPAQQKEAKALQERMRERVQNRPGPGGRRGARL